MSGKWKMVIFFSFFWKFKDITLSKTIGPKLNFNSICIFLRHICHPYIKFELNECNGCWDNDQNFKFKKHNSVKNHRTRTILEHNLYVNMTPQYIKFELNEPKGNWGNDEKVNDGMTERADRHRARA